jgi:cobalt-zinc-cadmium efflux system outer membrane protein
MFYGNAILTIFLAFSGVGRAGDGADSVHTEIIDTLTVLQAEQLLAERNAELRLSRLACTEAEANARQARRWENPEVSGIYNLYNPLNNRWLDPGNDGEVDISVSQPLPIGRHHRVNRCDAEVKASQADYDWTAFRLAMQMKRQMCELWAVQCRAALIEGELTSVDRILDAYRRNPQAVSLVEVRRLETLRLGLLSEQLERQATVAECKMALAVMLGLEETGFGIGELDLNDEPAPSDSILEQSALLRYHASLCEAADAEIRLQKALAWPRVNVGVEYDKNGNIGHNFWAVGASITLPLFDRNRGAIRSAEVERDRRQTMRTVAERELRQQLTLAAERITRSRRLVAEADSLAQWDIEAMERQYLAHNITLLELIDIYTAWREAQEMMVASHEALLTAAIDYDLAAGAEVYRIVDK